MPHFPLAEIFGKNPTVKGAGVFTNLTVHISGDVEATVRGGIAWAYDTAKVTATNGAVVIVVGNPTIKASSDTKIFVVYGNPKVTGGYTYKANFWKKLKTILGINDDGSDNRGKKPHAPIKPVRRSNHPSSHKQTTRKYAAVS